jgi:hypothetical protein
MRGNELFDVFYHDGKDSTTKLFHRGIPLLDDRFDESLLHDERVVTREFSCAGTREWGVSQV